MSFAGVSFVGDRRPSRSASAISVDDGVAAASGYHLLLVSGYSYTKDIPNGKSIQSRPFMVGGYRWCIHYYPNGKRAECADFVSLCLSLLDDVDDVAETLKVQFDFSFIDQVEKQGSAHVRASKACSFAGHGGSCPRSWGIPRFIRREVLERSKHLKDDCFTVRCDIIVSTKCFIAEEGGAAGLFVTVPPSDLYRDIGDLLRTKEGADVAFEVAGELFAAHRCVLAARSAVFKAQLFGPAKDRDTSSIVRVDDMEARVFRALLCFIYTDSLPGKEEKEARAEGGGEDGKVQDVEEEAAAAATTEEDQEDDEEEEDEDEEEEEDDEDEENEEDDKVKERDNGEEEHGDDEQEEEDDGVWQCLLEAADRYKLERLKLVCEEKLCARIGASTVSATLTLAEKHRCRGLKEACFKFLMSPANLRKVTAADGLDDIARTCPSLLKELVAKFAS